MRPTLIEGFRDQRDRHAIPKYHECAAEPEREIPLYDCHSSKYEWNQSLNFSSGDFDSGEADERFAWRCSCGAEVDCDLDRCSRCGSDEPGEPR